MAATPGLVAFRIIRKACHDIADEHYWQSTRCDLLCNSWYANCPIKVAAASVSDVKKTSDAEASSGARSSVGTSKGFGGVGKLRTDKHTQQSESRRCVGLVWLPQSWCLPARTCVVVLLRRLAQGV